MADSVSNASLRERTDGAKPGGVVSVRSFDEGVVETMNAEIIDSNYWIVLPGIDPPPGSPGIPVTFAFPEDAFEQFKIPVVVVRRDDISPAMQRWHPGTIHWRAPSVDALKANVNNSDGSLFKSGFDRVEEQQQSVPFDFLYTISILARSRGASRSQVNGVLDHVMRVYQPYCKVRLKDSLGDVRTYEAFNEGVSPLDDIIDIADRVLGFAITLRVEGELDLNDPATRKTVTQFGKLNFSPK